jgi:hypothetical protein
MVSTLFALGARCPVRASKVVVASLSFALHHIADRPGPTYELFHDVASIPSPPAPPLQRGRFRWRRSPQQTRSSS